MNSNKHEREKKQGNQGRGSSVSLAAGGPGRVGRREGRSQRHSYAMVVTSDGLARGTPTESETEEVEKRRGEVNEAEEFAGFLGAGRESRDFGFNKEVYLWLDTYIYRLVRPSLVI